MLNLPEIVDMYNCSQCSRRTESVFQLNHHVQRYHKNIYAAELFHAIVEPEQFLCTCCDYKSYYQFELYEHCKQVHNLGTGNEENKTFCEEIESYQCEYCRYYSDSSLSLVKHYDLCGIEKRKGDPQETTGEDEGMITPDFDGAVPKRTIEDVGAKKSNISTHSYYSKEKIDGFHQCNHCLYRTKRTSYLKTHMLKHATDEEIQWFRCNHCSYQAKQKSYLKRHVMNKHATNNEINWFQCKHCMYRAKQKSALREHIIFKHATDDEINWFQCNHCLYRAKRKSNLRRHMIDKHTRNEEINWFQCNHCPHRTKRMSDLRKHMICKHATNEKDINWFQCNQCPYKSKEKSHLRRHMVKHATNKEINRFQCNHCLYRAKLKSRLRNHMINKHAAKEEKN